MKKKILYISYEGLTSDIGQSQITPLLINLSKNNDISIITVEKNDEFENFGVQTKQNLEQQNIKWFPQIQKIKTSLLNAVNDIKKIRKTAYKLQQETKFDIVHCRNYIPSIIGQKMKQKFGVKFIFEIRGFWADEQIDNNIINPYKRHHRLVFNYFKKKEKQFLTQADSIIILTEKGKNILKKDWGVKIPVNTIPVFVDSSKFTPANSNEHNKNEIVFAFSGNVTPWYDLDKMLDFFKIVLDKYPKAKFKFFTKETAASILNKAIVRDINIEHFEIKHTRFNDLAKELKDVDFAIFFVKDVFSKSASMPIKIAEFLSMDIPVISNDTGDTKTIIEQAGNGIIINNFNIESYQKVIDKLPELTTQKQGHNYAKEYFDIQNITEKYNKIYRNL
jgi:glycosyltransferase involved in cell wall biosynthesis